MESVLILIIEAVVYGAVLFLLPLLVAKTFLREHIGKGALSVLMAVLLGLAVVSLTTGLAAALTEPVREETTTVKTRVNGNPFNLDIESR